MLFLLNFVILIRVLKYLRKGKKSVFEHTKSEFLSITNFETFGLGNPTWRIHKHLFAQLTFSLGNAYIKFSSLESVFKRI